LWLTSIGGDFSLHRFGFWPVGGYPIGFVGSQRRLELQMPPASDAVADFVAR